METSTRFRGNGDDRPLGELVQDLSRQTSTLIRQEMRLAQAELAEKGRHAGKGAGMFGGAGRRRALRRGRADRRGHPRPRHRAGAVDRRGRDRRPASLLIAGILALTGKKELEEAGPPKPEQTLDSVQQRHRRP